MKLDVPDLFIVYLQRAELNEQLILKHQSQSDTGAFQKKRKTTPVIVINEISFGEGRWATAQKSLFFLKKKALLC
jgi:hypothetical protein